MSTTAPVAAEPAGSRALVERLERSVSTLTWSVVVLVGVLVLVIIFGLRLYPRLNSGQDVLNDLHPAFTDERVAGDRAGITIVSQIVDLADPIVTRQGGAAAEVPKLVAFVSQKTGLSQAQVLQALQQNFPHTTALLQAVPLEDVTRELPRLVAFLSDKLGLSEAQVQAALAQSFPRLAQSIAALPAVTGGWSDVPGTAHLTRFDGSPVRTVPQVRDYFAKDVIPVLERQRANFQRLDTEPPDLNFIPPLLTAVGVLAILFGLGMILVFRPREDRGWEVPIAWSVVVAVGGLVLAFVFGARLYPSLDGGQKVLDDAHPAFTDERVAGDRAGITIVSQVVDLADPIVTRQGGAAAEVPKLVAFVSQKTGLSQAQVLQALQQNFPHTTALLQAVPLEDVTRELPRLVAFLSDKLGLSEAQVQAALAQSFPRLAQSIAALPAVTGGWSDVPGTAHLTRFDGSPVRTVPQVRDYFAKDVIPVLERQRANFHRLDGTWPPVNWFPPLLSTIALVVVLYGALLAFLTRPTAPSPRR